MLGMNDGLYATIAGNIRAEMARQRRTGVELAGILGKTRQAVSQRLTGKVRFTEPELTIVAEWLGISLDALATRPAMTRKRAAVA